MFPVARGRMVDVPQRDHEEGEEGEIDEEYVDRQNGAEKKKKRKKSKDRERDSHREREKKDKKKKKYDY